jgi:hypothetical protein
MNDASHQSRGPVEVAEKAADAPDKMVCKRFVETGSLVKGYRTCKTKREWEGERINIRSGSAGSNSCRDMANGGSECAF